MSQPDSHPVTSALADLRKGDSSAYERLLPMVYEELRALARNYLRRQQPGHTLQPTALVHEAFMRLASTSHPNFNDRVHFMAVAATAMRQLLVDHARKDQAAKRGGAGGGGGDWQRITLSAVSAGQAGNASAGIDLLDLDAALAELATLDRQQARIVELRYFGGLTIQEVAEEVGISTATVEREWRAARAWLASRLRRGEA